jgi:uncharacterized membrane protein YhaH (DUF805 family)
MDLFLSTQGRIGRGAFWGGMIGLIVVGMVAALVTGAQGFVGVIISLVLLYPVVALVLKRLRDRGRANPGIWAAIYLVPGQLVNLMQATGIGFSPMQVEGVTMMQPDFLGMIVTFAALIAFLCALVDLGFLAGRNRVQTVTA